MYEIFAHRMHNGLLRLALTSQMRIVTCVEDVISIICLEDTSGENVQILLFFRSARQHLTMFFKMYEVTRCNQKPRCSFAMIMDAESVDRDVNLSHS